MTTDAPATFDLRTERINRGLTQTALADLIGVNRHTIRRIEAGAYPNARTGLKIATWLGRLPVELWPVPASELRDRAAA